jgi:hypothetical protein
MNKRKHHTQEVAADKTGMSARRVSRDGLLASQKTVRASGEVAIAGRRGLGERGRRVLRHAPGLDPIRILRKTAERASWPVARRHASQLERPISKWCALERPRKGVFFQQKHMPGVRGLSDFNDLSKLAVTIAGASFAQTTSATYIR